MRAVVQRVSSAVVTSKERSLGEIGPGLLVLLGISPEDGEQEVEWLADKVAHLRIFEDDAGRMNRSLLDVGGDVMVVSQFTLYGDARKGRRPSFARAASGDDARHTYRRVIDRLRALGLTCETGEFGAPMAVTLTNEGPVTILLDSTKTF